MPTLSELDKELALRYGAYASYPMEDPPQMETYGDGPAEEVDRLLDRYASPSTVFLDLGCGAGFTLCRLAPLVSAAWGFDQSEDLLEAARLRAETLGLANTHFVSGNVALPTDLDPLPDDAFDLVLSRRGPNVVNCLPKMKPEALVIQELFHGYLGLLELFGRKTFLAGESAYDRWLVYEYSRIDLFPVSIKEYFFETYFRDLDHLATHLTRSSALYQWPMPNLPYEDARDRSALELYVRYNTTERGVRLIHRRLVYLFRRARVQMAPAAPELRPSW